MSNFQPNQSMLLTHLPDARVDMDSEYFFVSSSGNNDQERLEMLATQVFPEWQDGSLHHLAQQCQQYGIELWSAPEVELTQATEKAPFAFWLRFTQQFAGDALLQCELISQDRVH